jgi:tRNA dimethylallyltransferase
MADRWHPNERRKIQRSLEIYFQTGKPASEVYAAQVNTATTAEQSEGGNDNTVKSQLRFDPLVFWVSAPSDVLRPRLDSRVGTMLDAGLMEEVESLAAFYAHTVASGHSPDLTRGIWVAIGYKEFTEYVAALHRGESVETVTALKEEAIERTKISTRQYAKSQVKWIRNKFLPAMDRGGALDQVFLLQNTDAKLFTSEVELVSERLTKAFLEGTELPAPITLSEAAGELLAAKGTRNMSQDRTGWLRNECETCGTTTVTREQWQTHMTSNRHKKAVSGAARRELRRYQKSEPVSLG